MRRESALKQIAIKVNRSVVSTFRCVPYKVDGAKAPHYVVNNGFTLIELLVVIAIIGVLITIALPNFIGSKDKAKEAKVKAGIHAIRVALEAYATDHDGNYPPTDKVQGGDNSGDALIDGGYLIKLYPPNPFKDPEEPMKNNGRGNFSQGDFGYIRVEGETHNYVLQGFGAKKDSGSKKDGIIIEVEPSH